MLRNVLLALLASTAALSASSIPMQLEPASPLQQERMLIDRGVIYVLSAFDQHDHVTAYTVSGDYLWEHRFDARILSCNLYGNCVFVFSADRVKATTYLTCLDIRTGQLIWERP